MRTSYDLASRATLRQTGYDVSGEQADEIATAAAGRASTSHASDPKQIENVRR